MSIQCWDSNPRPLEHESPPITTRPGLPPKLFITFGNIPISRGIRTHDLQNMSLLPQPLDQGYRGPNCILPSVRSSSPNA